MVENIVRKGEIACYKQFLLYSQCFLQFYILVYQNAALCGNGLMICNPDLRQPIIEWNNSWEWKT